MVRIGFIQLAPKRLARAENLQAAARLAGDVSADLLVLPELFDTGYLFKNRAELQSVATVAGDGETCAFLKDLAKKRNCHLVAGFAEKAGDQVFNSSALVSPAGEVKVYRKIHLFNEEKSIFTPGDQGFRVHDLGFAKVGLMICFDWVFPEAVRTLALMGAQVILHAANLVLPWCQRAMVTRCLENRVFAVTANRVGTDEVGEKSLTFTGMSQIVGPRGDLLLAAPPAGEAALAIDIDPAVTTDKWMTPKNHLLEDRRPEFYL